MKIHIPLPLQIVIDDVGWWCGADGHARQEPYRTGLSRDHVPADYSAIASLGRQLHMRPQAAFVVCEWDRKNILRRVPTSTWRGADWDNRRWVGPWMEEAAAIIRANPSHLEITLHAIGHEYWENGRFTRAEWHDAEGRMRPRPDVLRHLEAYEEIFRECGIGSFPESFVPPAFLHAFGDGPEGFTALLKERGIRYISTPFRSLRCARRTEEALFGIDEGIMTVDRGDDFAAWNRADCFPPERKAAGPIVGLHWPNVLHDDPERNEEVVARWVAYLQPYDSRPHRMLARNTRAAWTQLAYHAGTGIRISSDPEKIQLDFSKLDAYRALGLAPSFTIKLETERPCEFVSRDLDILSSDFDRNSQLQVIEVARKNHQARVEMDVVAASTIKSQ